MKLTRREMLRATAAAAAASALPAVPVPPPPQGAPRFFTAAEFALVDELTDMIIPTDAQSGGARAAGVAAYIDARLAEEFEPPLPSPSPEGRGGQGVRARWRAGLQAVEALSREMSGKAFMVSTPEQRLAVLTRMANAGAGGFFNEIKGFTVRAYYTSRVGIHDDQLYKGNVYQTGEFAGFDPE